MKGAALGALGLLHGDVRMPHQGVGAGIGPGMGNPQAAADQQAFAVDPVGLGHGFGDALGHPLGALRCAAGVDEQGEFVAAQAGQLISGLQLTLEPRDHLQDQPVAGLMTEGVIGVAEVVQVQMPQGQAATVVFRQTRSQQGLEALAVGDAGQGVLLGQALQGRFQHTAFAHVAQAAAQGIGAQAGTHQPVADAHRGHFGLLVQQQNGGQAATPGAGLQLRRGQQDRIAVVFKQTADRLPAGSADQYHRVSQRSDTLAQQRCPYWLFSQ